MKLDAIKLELLEWLAKTNDEGTLAALMLYKKSSESPDWFDDLTESQIAQVKQGLDDIKKGKTISRKKLWQKYGRKV